MNTSEVLDLSKENIQPLKQGRHAVKLGNALQAQTNVELQQQLLAEREKFELLIRMYEGDDPLKPHYDYVHFIEQSFPKHGPESNIVQILENTLTTFKDDERYKQDLRYAELLIKYIDTQPNPLEIYQIVYDQGLCTMCAPFYKAWAEELDKVNDFKTADQIYELGIKVKALPLDLLPEAHLRFQLSVGRRLLGHREEPEEVESDYNRKALHKLQKRNIYSERDPLGAPGRIKQQPLGNHNNQNSAPFKIYQGDDDCKSNKYGENKGKSFPKQDLVNRENMLKPGPWTQHGGKHRSKGHVATSSAPAFQVHEDEGADMGSGLHKTPTVPRALKPRKIDNFTCPLAVFEPPDPTKKPMYCKNKVYAGGREFQFEELRAALYNRRYEQMAALRIQQEIEQEVKNELKTTDPVIQKLPDSDTFILPKKIPEEEPKAVPDIPVTYEEDKKEHSFYDQNVEHLIFQNKPLPQEANISLLHGEHSASQSFTVNTKEAMNVVQEMWNSPSPAPVFGKNLRASRPFPVSPSGLDESGVFKVPAPPPVLSKKEDVIPPRSVTKSKPSFPVFSDDEPLSKPSTPLPSFPIYSDEEPAAQCPPAPSSNEHFQIYSDDGEQGEGKNNKVESDNCDMKNENDMQPLQLFPPFKQQVASKCDIFPLGGDAATLKMLAFQSDSEEDIDDVPNVIKSKTEMLKTDNAPVAPQVASNNGTGLPSVAEQIRKSFASNNAHQPVFEEDRFDDMTCNTKAFDFVLPSSTPLVGHLKLPTGSNAKSSINGSYIVEEVKKCATKQDLSMIFEASKERYSSSSGSSGCKTQGSVCTAANTSIPPAQPELIEKLAQISFNKTLEEINKSVGLLNISGPIDPFSNELISRLLSHIGYPKTHHLIGLHRFESDAPPLQSSSCAKLGDTKYSVIGELGKGNYARVLKATKDGQPVALKQQRPAWEWEWYIVQEIQSRLPPNMMAGYLHMSNGYIFKNASILESEWAQYGSILSVVNKLKIAKKGHDSQLALLLSIQLISIVEHLHKCKIIHGDIKPDNFVLFSLPTVNSSELCLKLIDFGRSIDMTLFPEGTTFNTVVTTDGFQCNEMKEGRPWTYQTDLYGLAGSIYCLLFFDYMKVIKKDKKWQLSNKIPRYMMPAVWQEVFTTLLNVESCENLPDLTSLRNTLEQHYKKMDTATVSQSINKLINVLLSK